MKLKHSSFRLRSYRFIRTRDKGAIPGSETAVVATSPSRVFADRLRRYYSAILSIKNELQWTHAESGMQALSEAAETSREKHHNWNAIKIFCCARSFLEYFLWNAARGTVIKTELSEGVGGAFRSSCSCFAIASPRITNLKSLEERGVKKKKKTRGWRLRGREGEKPAVFSASASMRCDFFF